MVVKLCKMCADNNTNAVAQPSTAATQATQSNNTTDHEVMIVAEDHDESDAASNLGSVSNKLFDFSSLLVLTG